MDMFLIPQNLELTKRQAQPTGEWATKLNGMVHYVWTAYGKPNIGLIYERAVLKLPWADELALDTHHHQLCCGVGLCWGLTKKASTACW